MYAPDSRELSEPPLCVDLDGTLVRTDMLVETFVAAVKRSPAGALLASLALVRGRPSLKAALAERGDVDVATLPYNEPLVARLRDEHRRGRAIYLATASHETVAHRIAAHLGVFTGVIATRGDQNLKGESKARALVERFGEKGYDYVGEDRHDVPAWRHAREAIVSRPPGGGAWPVFRAIRAYQWTKNLLVFVPLLAAHRLDTAAISAAALAWLAFSLAASAIYLGNDILDLQDDRRHPGKRRRALAAGDMPLVAGLALAPLLLIGAAAICAFLPPGFGQLVAAYVVVNVAYSTELKKVPVLDVMILGGLYTMRILAGAAAIDVPVSHWMLGFSLFMFLSIALAKRYVELDGAAREQRVVGGRGYVAGDMPVLLALDIASGCLSVLIFALYITSPQVTVLYRRPEILWFAVPVMQYWVARVWFLTRRGELHDDPLIFALRDIPSYVVAGLVGLAVAAAA